MPFFDPANGFHLPALEEVPAQGLSLPQDSPSGISSSAETTRTTPTPTVVPVRGLTDTPLRPASSALDLFVSRRDRSMFDRRLVRWMFTRPTRSMPW